MQHGIKRLVTTLVVASGVVLLAACVGHNTSSTSSSSASSTTHARVANLSGKYYFVQYAPAKAQSSTYRVHALVLHRRGSSNQRYVAQEIGMGGTKRSRGQLVVKSNRVSLTLPHHSWTLDKGRQGYVAAGTDISKIEALTFTFHKGVLGIGSNPVRFYSQRTTKGKQYAAVQAGKRTWAQAFPSKHQQTAQASSSSSASNSSSSSSSSAATSSSSKQAAAKASSTNSGMNLTQIQQGNYSSLAGSWQEVAVAGNNLGGQPGYNWSQDSQRLTDQLTVTNNQVTTTEFTLSGSSFNIDGTDSAVKFGQNAGALEADLVNQDVTTNYSIEFYPRGTAVNKQFNNGVTDDTSKNRIVVWSSNNGYTQYFVQQ
ncbi:DUF6287 domain-containing protein [Lacticaseibacillus thailandensis]|nr:DUF6287 domain-containing protein [Lacticaseibacillus thailandensis]